MSSHDLPDPNALKNSACVPCQGGVAPMSRDEASAMLPAIAGWQLSADATKLSCTFRFKNFMLAQGFAARVGEISEIENHHPDICYGWGYCTVQFYTHKIGGLHENDFIMAARVNAIAT